MHLVIILAIILMREINSKHVARSSGRSHQQGHSCCDIEQRTPKRAEGWIELELKCVMFPEAMWCAGRRQCRVEKASWLA